MSGIARGIRYAVDEGARIVNVSICGARDTTELEQALRYAAGRDVTVVAAAGNDHANTDRAAAFPRRGGSVGHRARRPTGDLASCANFGLRNVDLAAPGSSILSTIRGGRYGILSGTSMAAAFASGALALLTAEKPGRPQRSLRRVLIATAFRRGGGPTRHHGAQRRASPPSGRAGRA